MNTILYRIIALIIITVSIAIGALLMAPALLAQGPGDLLVTPTRALFEGGKRNEVLTLINRGSDTATYQISVIQYRMTKEGELERIDTPDAGQNFATDLVRFFPRQVTIGPGETQNVRLQLRIPEGLADGEYRSHLYFRSVPKQEAAALAPDTATAKEFSVKLTAVFGVTVPVIVRQGELSSQVSMSNLMLKPGSSPDHPVLSLTFNRSGNQSVYGALRITFKPESGAEVPIGGVGGIAVYTPNRERSLELALNPPQGLGLHNGTLKVVYESLSDLKADTLATAELAVE